MTVWHRFRNECKAAGKKIMVWTVNEPEHMMEVSGFVLILPPSASISNAGCTMGH